MAFSQVTPQGRRAILSQSVTSVSELVSELAMPSCEREGEEGREGGIDNTTTILLLTY